MSKPKRLYRSESEKMLAGVAGGLAEYFEIDPTLVRIGFVIASLFWGGGLVIYIAMWILVPTKSNVGKTGEETLSQNVAEIKESAKKAGDFVKEKVEEVQKGEEKN